MEEFELVRVYTFSAAHKLPWHNGKCRNLHGHTYKLEVHITTNKLNGDGVVIDFHELDKYVTNLLKKLDHQYLNDILDNPTCELLAKYIFEELNSVVPVTKVGVWESERGGVFYKKLR